MQSSEIKLKWYETENYSPFVISEPYILNILFPFWGFKLVFSFYSKGLKFDGWGISVYWLTPRKEK